MLDPLHDLHKSIPPEPLTNCVHHVYRSLISAAVAEQTRAMGQASGDVIVGDANNQVIH